MIRIGDFHTVCSDCGDRCSDLHTAATLLAGLAATRDADQAQRFARLLPGGAA